MDGTRSVRSVYNIINHLLHTSEWNMGSYFKSFSYTVEVSRDKSNWLKLFDYASFACRGMQDLPFPKQAIR